MEKLKINDVNFEKHKTGWKSFLTSALYITEMGNPEIYFEAVNSYMEYIKLLDIPYNKELYEKGLKGV